MKKILLVLCVVIGAMLLSSCNFSGEWEISHNGNPVAKAQVEDLREEEVEVEEVEESETVVEETETVVEDVVFTDHITWSIYEEPSFLASDGTVTESGSDIFTDPTKGSLTLTITPTEDTCLLQYGETTIFSTQFSASFEDGDIGAGFRVIAFSYWENLPESDGAFEHCWIRETSDELVSIPLWETYGEPSFLVNDGNVTETGSDLFTNPTKGSLSVTVTPSEETCLLQYGETQVFTNQFEASFEEGDTEAGFRVISYSYWENLPKDDGAFDLCWPKN